MIANSHILLDTCILNNLLSKEENLAKTTSKLLESLSKKENIFTNRRLLRLSQTLFYRKRFLGNKFHQKKKK